MDRYDHAERSVIGSMLIDEKCVPVVLPKLEPEDFIDPTCRNFFTGIRALAQEGRPIDPVTVMDKLKSGSAYVPWARETMDLTPTAANVEAYIPMVRERAVLFRFHELCNTGLECADVDQAQVLVRKMVSGLSASDKMPRKTANERFSAVFEWLKSKEKPQYLPWGIPTVNRATYAELGDMILLGGYASSGKTLLSLSMAQAQVAAGYKVGYYSLETSAEKLTMRQLSALSGIPLGRLKEKNLRDSVRSFCRRQKR